MSVSDVHPFTLLYPDNFSALFEGEGDAKFHEARVFSFTFTLVYKKQVLILRAFDFR